MIDVRSATLNDSKDIFTWRNDVQTRQMSHNSDVLTWDEHSRWFEATLASENRRLLVCIERKTNSKVGIVRLDIGTDSAEISINLAPNMRGKGLGKVCLIQAIKSFQCSFPQHKTLNAEIKPENLSSQKSFEGVGFKFNKEVDKVRHYTLNF